MEGRNVVRSLEQVVAEAEPAVAFVKGKFSSGTGFLFRPGVLATNKHVIGNELVKNLEIHFPSAAQDEIGPKSCELLYVDPNRDLALLKVESNISPLPMGIDDGFHRGQEVLVIGNPGVSAELTLKNAISRGVLSTEVTIDGKDYYQLGISVNPGNSGGPVLDMFGRIIGVITLRASQQEGLGFCIPLGQLDDCLLASDVLSDEDRLAMVSDHRLRVVFAQAEALSKGYLVGMEVYVKAMQAAMNLGQSADQGLAVVQAQVTLKLSEVEGVVARDLKLEIQQVTRDRETDQGTRDKIVDLWANYLELKGYVENPRGSFDTYSVKFRELSDKNDRLTRSLKLLLGVNDGD